METNQPTTQPTSTVALFATCLLNNFRPSVGFASVRLLEAVGYSVAVPSAQTCCGQPNYNNGDPESARQAAEAFINLFGDYEFIVVPSASCGGMIKNHFPKLLSESPLQDKAEAVAAKTWELADFLCQKSRQPLPINERFTETITHHDSCSAIREMKVTTQVRSLLQHCFPNADFKSLQEPEACCGFGGTFCVKFNDISGKMGNNKLADIDNTKATWVSSLDLGCALHLQSLTEESASRRQADILHFAELLDRHLFSEYATNAEGKAL